MEQFDLSRSREVFSPTSDLPTAYVIGVGATGSHIAETLACLGYPIIIAMDPDEVELHNLGNQAFSHRHVGKHKTKAMEDIIAQKMGFLPDDYIFAPTALTEGGLRNIALANTPSILFLCVDGVETRKKLVSVLYDKGWGSIQLIVETRIAARHGNVYTLRPYEYQNYLDWQSGLTTDDDPAYETSSCGGSLSVKPTIMNVASHAVWAMLDHLDGNRPDYRLNTFMQPPATGLVSNAPVNAAEQLLAV